MADWLIVVLISATVRADPLEGFRTYQPVYRERRRVRGARVYVTRPLLGRYILAELDADWPRQFHLIRRVECVRGILTAEEKPVVAREAEVTALRARERRGFIELPPRVRFKFDQRVTVTRGPFVTHEARYREERGVLDVVEISLFGAPREILLPEGSIVAA